MRTALRVQIKGIEAPWTELYKNFTVKAMGGFEAGAGSWGEGSGHYDGLGWGSLLYHLDAADVSVVSVSSTLLASSSRSTVSSGSAKITPTSTFQAQTSTSVSSTPSILSQSTVLSDPSTVTTTSAHQAQTSASLTTSVPTSAAEHVLAQSSESYEASAVASTTMPQAVLGTSPTTTPAVKTTPVHAACGRKSKHRVHAHSRAP